jgi:hypothetical protein
MSSNSKSQLLSVALASFAAGAAIAATVALTLREKKKRRVPTKKTHPREWAVFSRVDREKKGWFDRNAIRSLCYRFESDEHADLLCNILDPEHEDHITFEDFVLHFKAVQVMRTAARLKLWHRCCGLGIAGNVAGHMSQAGEAGAESKTAIKPAALFTFYMPPDPFTVCDHQADRKRLERFPVTYAVLDFPKLPGASKIQVEPELALYVDIIYSQDRTKVERLIPHRICAFNDCSIRSLDGADKLSMKKNWGFGSKGMSIRSFEIDSFAPGSFVDHLVLISYVKRDEQIQQYSVRAPARSYLLFYEPLLDWVVDTINTQTDCDKWEEIFPSLVRSYYPTSAWIALGAGEYTDWGQKNYLKPGDEAVIAVYDERLFPDGPCPAVLNDLFDDRAAPAGIISLHQTFV